MRKKKTRPNQKCTSLFRYAIIIASIGCVIHPTNRECSLRANNTSQPRIYSRTVIDSLPNAWVGEEFQATAYCTSGITRSGARTALGLVAADPKVIPLGSIIHVDSPLMSGLYYVMDTGRLIKGKIIDIYIPSYELCMEFGRRKVELKVLRYGFNGQSPQ